MEKQTLNVSFLLFILTLLTIITHAQPECHLQRFPQVIPLQYGQQASINMQQFIKGSNLTFSVEPNDFHSNIQPQYSCKSTWNYRLGKIIQTESYQVKINNKTETYLAMLGASSYFKDIYYIYYGIKAKQDENTNNYEDEVKQTKEGRFSEKEVLVLQVPRQKMSNCGRFKTIVNNTHLEFILDCRSLSNPLNKLIASTIISLSQDEPTPQWMYIESPIYLPQQMVPSLNVTSSIAVIQTSKSMNYLIRMIMTQYADYVEVWRWTSQSKQIIGLYDSLFFIQQGQLDSTDVDLRQMQTISNTILILDLLNGLHVLQLSQTGSILYKTTLQMNSFSYFHYDPKQQLLFMAKRGQIQQYQVKLLSMFNIKTIRIQRYHLYGFQDIKQIIVQNRFLYVSTLQYIHVIHLTNIGSNLQDYQGSYNVYPQLYTQIMLPLQTGFVRVDCSQANVQISQCQTHPPFLHLKSAQFTAEFTVKAVSVINGISSQCELNLRSVMVQADEDKIYLNGYESQNETIYSNRPGRAIMQLQKYGIGRNLQYEIILYNHQIEFEYKIRKVNNQSCVFKYQKSQANQNSQNRNGDMLDSQSKGSNNEIKTFSVGNWLIVEHLQDRVKEYFRCQKYNQIQCNFIQLYITLTNSTKSVFQLLEEQKTKRQSLQEAVLYQINNQSTIQLILISPNQKKGQEQQFRGQLQEQLSLSSVRTLCRVRLPQGEQYKIGEMKLRGDKLYVVLPRLKQVRIYESLLSLQQNQQCHYYGSINMSSFNSIGLYFSPQHIDFDKHQLNRPYTVPSFQMLHQGVYSQGQSIQTMFITQFNEVLVVRVNIGSDTINRVELLKEITLDRSNQANDIEVIVTLPNVLAMDKTTKLIAQYYITHTYDRSFVRNYPFYIINTTDTIIKLIDSNTFAVMTQPDTMNHSYAQVYSIDSIVTSFKQFAKFKVQGPFHVMSFNQEQFEFITAQSQQTTINPQLICNATTLTPSPYVQIQIPKPNYDDEPSKQQFFLTLNTLLDSKRQVVTLQVASDSSDIEKGSLYPYTTYSFRIQEDEDEKFFEIDDLNWFQGNIWNHKYVCNDCKTGRIRFQDKIFLKQKIQLQSFNVPNDFYVTKINHFEEQYVFQTIQGYLMTTIKSQSQNDTWLLQNPILNTQGETFFNYEAKENITYTFSQSLILSSNIQNNPKCIKSSPQDHDLYFVSMCSDYEFLDDSALIELRLYSTTGFKPFVIHQYLIQLQDLILNFNLKAGTKSQKQLIVTSSSLQQQQNGNYDTVFVRFDDNIWVFLILDGKLELIYTIDNVDLDVGNHLCWIQVIKRKVNSQFQQTANEQDDLGKTVTQYGIIASMCESGIYHMVFTVDSPQLKSGLTAQKQPLPSFHLLTQQEINLENLLQKSKIQLPQHSYFLQTIVKQIQNRTDEFELFVIVSDFNSFIWKVSLIRESLIVSGMQLAGIVRRYNEYSAVQVTSHDDRYFTVLYKSTQNVNVSQFLAVYDTEYYFFNEQKQIKQYFMFSVQRTNDSPVQTKKSQVFQMGTNLFILRKNQIKIFEVFNMIRVHVQKKMPLSINKHNFKNHEMDENKKLSLTYQSLSGQSTGSYEKNLVWDQQAPILYSQSIVIFVETPTEVNSVTIKLFSVDYFELSGWAIALIVIGSILVVLLLYYGLSELWKYYQKKRKLVRLETHLLDDVSSSERDSHDYERQIHEIDYEQANPNPPQGRQSQITTEDAPLTKSLLERYRQFEPERDSKAINSTQNNQPSESKQYIQQDPIKE